MRAKSFVVADPLLGLIATSVPPCFVGKHSAPTLSFDPLHLIVGDTLEIESCHHAVRRLALDRVNLVPERIMLINS
jgi:hypothetical protein